MANILMRMEFIHLTLENGYKIYIMSMHVCMPCISDIFKISKISMFSEIE